MPKNTTPKPTKVQTPPPFDPGIDETRLDAACLAQPGMFYRMAAELASARRTHAEAKQERDVTYAELNMGVRADPAAFGVLKVTEDGIKAAITISSPYREAVNAVIAAEHRVDVLKAAVDALQHRKSALESLVYLHGQNYFSAPRVPDSPQTDRGWGIKQLPKSRVADSEDDV